MTPEQRTEALRILQTVRDAGATDDNNGGEDWTHSDARIAEALASLENLFNGGGEELPPHKPVKIDRPKLFALAKKIREDMKRTTPPDERKDI